MEWSRERDRVINVSAGQPQPSLLPRLYGFVHAQRFLLLIRRKAQTVNPGKCCFAAESAERCACGCAGKVVGGADGDMHSDADTMRLVAALTRASLPMHYRVTLDNERAPQ